jgi:hypothetical protein
MQLTTITHYSESKIKALAIKCETSPATLRVIMQGQQNRILDTIKIDEAATRAGLQKIIFGVAESYTSAKLTTEAGGITEAGRLVLGGCIKLMLNKFKTLGPSEIVEAFEQAAAGQIEANLNAYNGKFTVAIFGQVLSAYKKRRDKIRQRYESILFLESKQTSEAEKNAKNEAAQKKVLDNYYKLLDRKQAGEEITAEDIPHFWGEILAKLDVLKVEPVERAEIFKEAKRAAILEFKQEIQNTALNAYNRKDLKSLLKAVLEHTSQGGDAGDFEQVRAAAVRIYSKEIVLKSLENETSPPRN